MNINVRTWPSIEARLNQIYEKEEIKFTQSEIHGQKPVKREKVIKRVKIANVKGVKISGVWYEDA